MFTKGHNKLKEVTPTQEEFKIVFDEVVRCQKLLKDKVGVLVHIPHLEFVEPRGKWGGMAFGHYKIQINHLHLKTLKEGYREMMAHEYAHICIDFMNTYCRNHSFLGGDNSGGHGKAWKKMLKFFGYAGTRTYSREEYNLVYGSQKEETFKYKAVCGCVYNLSKIRHNKVQRGMQHYRCREHKNTLFFSSKQVLESC